MNFGQRLKSIRKDRGLSQKQLGEAFELGQTTIANYEKNLRFPNHDVLVKLGNYFNVTIDFLIGRDVDSIEGKFSEEQIKEMYHSLLGLLLDEDENAALNFVLNLELNDGRLIQLYELVYKPILVKIGTKWQDGEISVAKEHFITGIVNNLVAKSFLTAPQEIDDLKQKNDKNLGVAMCLSVSGDSHNIGIRMVSDYFSLLGYSTYYIGSNVPTDALIDILLSKKPEILAISATLEYHIDSLANLIHVLKTHSAFKENNVKLPLIVVGGQAFCDKQRAIATGADLYAKDFYSLKEALEEK